MRKTYNFTSRTMRTILRILLALLPARDMRPARAVVRFVDVAESSPARSG